MRLNARRTSGRGVVLIVVVGVLALLSVIAATFGIMMSGELAASRNQTDYEMARQAALAGEEYLINALQTLGAAATSGTLPDFNPNPSDPFGGQLLYKGRGTKVYFATCEQKAPGPNGTMITPYWLLGLGNYDAGMFNLNGMGFAGDLGSNCNPDIRCTSFDTSLVRLLTARFATIGGNDLTNLQAYYPNFANIYEQQRIAIMLNRAIINWRHGPDGVPGTAGTEERRLGHLPRWNSKPPWSYSDAGVGYPNASSPGIGAYPFSTFNHYDWGWGDGLPSRYINWAGFPSLPLIYAEPGVWATVNDTGLPVPGMFYGKVAAGSSNAAVVADTTLPGWRDWATDQWVGYAVYFATGAPNACRWTWSTVLITGNTSNTLTVGSLGTGPAVGDAFCITPVDAGLPMRVGVLNKRWDNVTLNVGDLVASAMYWPDGTLATEGNVWDLRVDGGTVGAATNGASTPPPYASITDANAAKVFPNYAGLVVHIYAGKGRGQVRTIVAGGAGPTLNVSPNWPTSTIPDITSLYYVEYPDNNLPSKYQPNNPQGDDRLYLSLGDLRDSVIVPALNAPPPAGDGLPLASAQAVADILLPYFQKNLSVSTQSLRAGQSLIGINDPAMDGVDNSNSGVDSLTEEGWATLQTIPIPIFQHRPVAYIQSMYQKLGLKDWTRASVPSGDPARIKQAAQLLANIIDFGHIRDVPGTRDVPTLLSDTDLGETTATGAFTAAGAKGPHVTQIMPSPDAIYSVANDGTEMTLDGGPATDPIGPLHDMVAWDWRDATNPATPPPAQIPPAYPPNPCWQVMDGTTPVATFKFTVTPGFYAMRLIGAPNNTTFTLTCPTTNPTPYYVTLKYPDPGGNANWFTGFVRTGNGPTFPLACFDGTSGSLIFKLQPPAGQVGVQFRGLALCAQYIQLTNISTHDIQLNDNQGHGWTVTTDQKSATIPAITLPPNYRRPVDSAVLDLRRIPGAASTGSFPIKYGTYVICMCEEAYEKQWTPKSTDPPDGESNNQNGKWGDAKNEAYPVFPAGDISDDYAMALLLGTVNESTAIRAPSVVVKDAAATPHLIAGGSPTASATGTPAYVDGAIPANNDPFPVPPAAQTPSPKCYSSIEKTVLLQPTWDPAATTYWNWAVYQPSPMVLSGSQNRLVSTQTDGPRIPATAVAPFRSCLNKNYAALWDSGGAFTLPTLTKPSVLAAANQVFLIILNRPYPTTGWLGLVPTSSAAWRTIDPNPTPWQAGSGQPDTRDAPEKLLGTLLVNATAGGVYARFNINTATADTLKAVFSDADAALIVARRQLRIKGLPPAYNPSLPACLGNQSWVNWDEMLVDNTFQNSINVPSPYNGIGFYDSPGGPGDLASSGVSNADAGAGTYADGFPDSSNEKKEWFMRFSNLFDLQSTDFRFVVAGLVYKDQPWDSTNLANNAPIATVRIEVAVSTNPLSIVHFRYLGQ